MPLPLRFVMIILSLCLAACPAAVRKGAVPQSSLPGPTGIAGRVAAPDGTPAAGSYVYAYRSPRGGLRGPADFEARVDGEGRYFLDLVEGTYYLVARLRPGGGDAGPPRAGDAWAIYPVNPVVVTPEHTTGADFVMRGVTQPRILKEGSLSSGDTGLTGQVVDSAGQPVAGITILAYRSLDLRRMPDLTAPATGSDGRFTLYVPQGGRYCLVARQRTRGQPVSGEPYGVLGEGEAGCREVKRGEMLDVGTIVLGLYRK